ncbi:MAG: DUF3280 domain-containing protein [Paracoccaceae bacterium]
MTLLMAAWPALAEVPEPGTLAYFGVHFIDTSTEGDMNGIRADETARTEMVTSYVANDMRERGYTLVPTDPVAERLAKVSNPARCNGCDVTMARDLGAEYALAGEVQKVSNLILNVNLVLRDARSGKIVRSGSVDIRGNNDESWRRGFSYLLRNIIFRDQ